MADDKKTEPQVVGPLGMAALGAAIGIFLDATAGLIKDRWDTLCGPSSESAPAAIPGAWTRAELSREFAKVVLGLQPAPAQQETPIPPEPPASVRSSNKWNLRDDHPDPRYWHVRYQTPETMDTGYMFGRNFSTLPEAVQFISASVCQCRLLRHIEGEDWLLVQAPLNLYYVPEVS